MYMNKLVTNSQLCVRTYVCMCVRVELGMYHMCAYIACVSAQVCIPKSVCMNVRA